MDFTQIKETALYVKDLDRTKAFYGNLLGLEMLSKVEGRHIFFRAGSSVLLCFLAEATKAGANLPAHFAEGQQHIAFEVPKAAYEEVRQRIRSSGIEIEHRQQWNSEYESFYFRDPDGHSLEIVPAGLWDD